MFVNYQVKKCTQNKKKNRSPKITVFESLKNNTHPLRTINKNTKHYIMRDLKKKIAISQIFY